MCGSSRVILSCVILCQFPSLVMSAELSFTGSGFRQIKSLVICPDAKRHNSVARYAQLRACIAASSSLLTEQCGSECPHILSRVQWHTFLEQAFMAPL